MERVTFRASKKRAENVQFQVDEGNNNYDCCVYVLRAKHYIHYDFPRTPMVFFKILRSFD